jgi:ATP-binding cassette subfamily B protein/subfamily B ATP-binding cassette protein MsbA
MWIQVRRLLIELKPFKKTLIIVGVAGLFMALAQWQLALKLQLLNDSLNEGKPENLIKIPPMFLSIMFVASVSRYLHLANMNYIAEQVTMRLRLRLQRKFMDLSQSFHINYDAGSGGLISRILSDIIIIQNGMRLVADFFTQPLTFFLLLGVLFYRDAKLTLYILIFLPFVLFILKQIGRSLRKYGTESQKILERVATIVKESIDGVRVIQSFRLESVMSKRFESVGNEYLVTRKKFHFRGEAAGPIVEFIATVIMMIIFMHIGMRISHGESTSGEFISYLGALIMLQQPIKKIQDSWVKFQETAVATGRVFSILESQQKIPEVSHPVSFPENWKSIEYRNVSFAYGQNEVLKNLNLTIKRGDIIALVGESGSGKSTIVNLLERFFDPISGEILIDGIDIRNFSLDQLRKNVALVTQDVFLFSDTIGSNINSGDYTKDSSHIEAAAKMANAHNFITNLPKQYTNQVGDRGGMLSGGEKQRVSIARAIFKDAPILILDEATSALDSASELEVQKGLDILMQGRTTIVVAHRLSTVLHANKIVVMKKGQIIESGTHQSLLETGGEYSKFISLQKLI